MRLSDFNKKQFSLLLNKAKGDRTLNQFSLISGVDAGYISRFITLKRDNPPSPEVLQKIAKVAHNDVSYADLMMAAGYIKSNDIENTIEIPTANLESETLADEFIQILIDEGLIEEGQELTEEQREKYLDLFRQSIKLAKKLK